MNDIVFSPALAIPMDDTYLSWYQVVRMGVVNGSRLEYLNMD